MGDIRLKIEMGESLLLSWLRHVKECQIVQMNWKPSSRWNLQNYEILNNLKNRAQDFFHQEYGYNIFKNSRLDQIISQAEIDVIGVARADDTEHLYAIDVAFHEFGLNYGFKEETVARVIKKCIRTIMCISGYFGNIQGTVIFASPKISPAPLKDISRCIEDVQTMLTECGLNFQVRVIANEQFKENILEPVLNVMNEVADTSELFMRSMQMYGMFAKDPSLVANRVRKKAIQRSDPEVNTSESDEIKGLEEMKIGAIVRTIFRDILESGGVSNGEIDLMQTKDYSKDTFDIQYPLLVDADTTNGISPKRYYSSPITIKNKQYFLCSEWYEVPTNNDRPYLIKWLKASLQGP